MKRLLSVFLVVVMLASVAMLAGCGKGPTLKMGLGVHAAYDTDSKNADGEVKGSASVAVTGAAVLLDKDGKIVKCTIDSVDAKVEYTSAGEAVVASEYKTKGELGTAYGMVAYGGAKLEWNEQVAAFCKVAEGKTVDQVKALVVNGYKGNDEVIAAGCTIGVQEMVTALVAACENAVDTEATAKSTLALSFVVKPETENATADKNGSADVVANICAAAVNEDGKVAAMRSDAVEGAFSFNNKGELVTDTAKAIASKRQQGTSYGMVAYGGAKKEWFEQIDAFDAACVGKTANEISALAVNGKGVESLQTAGCTITITDTVAAAVKAAK